MKTAVNIFLLFLLFLCFSAFTQRENIEWKDFNDCLISNHPRANNTSFCFSGKKQSYVDDETALMKYSYFINKLDSLYGVDEIVLGTNDYEVILMNMLVQDGNEHLFSVFGIGDYDYSLLKFQPHFISDDDYGNFDYYQLNRILQYCLKDSVATSDHIIALLLGANGFNENDTLISKLFEELVSMDRLTGRFDYYGAICVNFVRNYYKKDSTIINYFNHPDKVRLVLENPYLYSFATEGPLRNLSKKWLDDQLVKKQKDSICRVRFTKSVEESFEQVEIEIDYSEKQNKVRYFFKENWIDKYEIETNKLVGAPESSYRFDSYVLGVNYYSSSLTLDKLDLALGQEEYNLSGYGLSFTSRFMNHALNVFGFQNFNYHNTRDEIRYRLSVNSVYFGLGYDLIKSSFLSISPMINLAMNRKRLNIIDQTSLINISSDFSISNTFNTTSYSFNTRPSLFFSLNFPYLAAGIQFGYDYDLFNSSWSNDFGEGTRFQGYFINAYLGTNFFVEN